MKKENGNKYDIKWYHGFLGKQLSIGSVALKGNGHVINLYTLNHTIKNYENLEASCQDLPDFSYIGISVYTDKDKTIEKMAYEISSRLEAKGYHVRVRRGK